MYRTCPWCGETEEVQPLESEQVNTEVYFCKTCQKIFWYDEETNTSLKYQK